MRCTVCYSNKTKIYAEIKTKKYWECLFCFAKFLDRSDHLCEEDEYAHYCTHQNKIDDPNYRKFLSKLSIPLKCNLTNHRIGLDYGCGPGPALAAMLEEDGFQMCKYDPFFFPNKKIFSKKNKKWPFFGSQDATSKSRCPLKVDPKKPWGQVLG